MRHIISTQAEKSPQDYLTGVKLAILYITNVSSSQFPQHMEFGQTGYGCAKDATTNTSYCFGGVNSHGK